ncbi:MAG: hypothetical protein K6G71_09375 [Clostridiales bacterium]|nr:hypothetical protein [Clostridiales bacterium]
MMISPESFIEFECKGKSYKELLKIRDELLESVYDFEKGRISSEEKMIMPSPEVVYQMNLEYLGELCKLIAETYNQEVVCQGEE